MKATIQSIDGLGGLLERLSRQMQLANRAESTIACYSRVVRDLCKTLRRSSGQGPEKPRTKWTKMRSKTIS